MSLPREPNPLRPYYVPPSVGQPPSSQPNAPATPTISSKHAYPSAPSFGSSARNILADMDYTDYISDSSPAAAGVFKGLLEQALWKYMSVLLAQPFDVAKTVLQVHVASAKQRRTDEERYTDDGGRKPGKTRHSSYGVSLVFTRRAERSCLAAPIARVLRLRP